MRLAIVDTLATIIFFTALAALTELYIGGMEPGEVLKTRLIMVPMMLVTGRPYGAWRDWFFKTTKPTVSWSKSLIDGAAFLTFQLPIYGLTLWVIGAEHNEILRLLSSTALIMLIISRPFGLFLEAIRKIAGTNTE
jgi:hypothetical protein